MLARFGRPRASRRDTGCPASAALSPRSPPFPPRVPAFLCNGTISPRARYFLLTPTPRFCTAGSYEISRASQTGLSSLVLASVLVNVRSRLKEKKEKERDSERGEGRGGRKHMEMQELSRPVYAHCLHRVKAARRAICACVRARARAYAAEVIT